MLTEAGKSGIKKLDGQKNKDSSFKMQNEILMSKDTEKCRDGEEGSRRSSSLRASMFSAVGGKIMC